MANQYVNKVEYGNDTLIDLTEDSVTPNTLLPNTTAHNRSGAPISGSASASVLPAVDTDNILGGGAGASTNTQAMLDGLADGLGDVRTDLSDEIKTRRVATGEHNLFRNTIATQTLDNLTLTVYDDGSFKVNGTNSRASGFTEFRLGTFVFDADTNYIANGCTGGSASPNTFFMQLIDLNAGGTYDKKIINGDTNIPNNNTTSTLTLRLVVFAGVQLDNKMFYPMIRLSTDTDPTFAPFAMTNRELTANNINYPVKLTSSNDLNSIKTPGYYYWGDSLPTNLPGTLYYSSMSVQRLWTDGKIIQIIQRNGEMYTRAWTGSAWNGWYKFTGTAV